jgi:enoyl-CoA hydratase/carnithine racemase
VGAFVSTERRDAVALVTIDNPPVNALSAALLAELHEVVEALDADDAVRAIVLTGGGERAFVAGADIKEFPALREDADGGPARALVRLGLRIEAGHTPVIAAIRGFCLGGGLELALCCDLRVCADDARLGQPEIKLGLIPGAGGTQRLPRVVGIGRSMLLNLTGEPVDAATAERWGLVERVVTADALLDEAMGLAAHIAEQSPHAVGVLRELARTTRDLPLEEGLRLEGDAFLRCIRSDDGAEGIAAFLEKRPPRFGS